MQGRQCLLERNSGCENQVSVGIGFVNSSGALPDEPISDDEPTPAIFRQRSPIPIPGELTVPDPRSPIPDPGQIDELTN
jgi:hypothetical protein